MAAAHGLKPLELPPNFRVACLSSLELIESVFSSLMAPLDHDGSDFLLVSLDAEWKRSRKSGVSILQIAPHSEPDSVYVIPVSIIFLFFNFQAKLVTALQIPHFASITLSLSCF
jgi:hypothetical protein